MKVIFVTTNPEKLKEAKLAIQPFGHEVEGMSFSFNEPYEGSMEEVARFKLEQLDIDSNVPIFVDDSGIFFEAYQDFPGILTRRIFNLIGYKGIDKLLQNESRRAYFYGVIAVKWRDHIKIFTGKTNGRIVDTLPTNLPPDLRFPFDPIFVPDGDNMVLGDMSIEKRVYYSYRRFALEQFGEWLKSATLTV